MLTLDMGGELLFFFKQDLIAVVLVTPRIVAVVDTEAELMASVTKFVLRAN